jgi:hypothetical protein
MHFKYPYFHRTVCMGLYKELASIHPAWSGLLRTTRQSGCVRYPLKAPYWWKHHWLCLLGLSVTHTESDQVIKKKQGGTFEELPHQHHFAACCTPSTYNTTQNHQVGGWSVHEWEGCPPSENWTLHAYEFLRYTYLCALAFHALLSNMRLSHRLSRSLNPKPEESSIHSLTLWKMNADLCRRRILSGLCVIQ